MKLSQYGPCGLYCAACGAEDCDGCRSENVDEYVLGCKFRQCTREKELQFCCYCDEYPCPELYAFMNDEWPHHGTMQPNLDYIRKHGFWNWMEAQKKEWSCKNCGTAILWYQRECACGQQLEAWDPPV